MDLTRFIKSTPIISSHFGWRTLRGKPNFHHGVDLKIGNVPCYGYTYGKVLRQGYQPLGAGNYVIVQHVFAGKVFEFNYFHLKTRLVKNGQEVDTNTQIGIVGTTGDSTGNHLHLGIKDMQTKEFVDPEKWIEPVEPKPVKNIYSGSSIVDYLKSTNQDSSYTNRKKLAVRYGIKGYVGTPNQNVSLLKAIRGF